MKDLRTCAAAHEEANKIRRKRFWLIAVFRALRSLLEIRDTSRRPQKKETEAEFHLQKPFRR